MARDNRSYRGLLQSNDGYICRVVDFDGQNIFFETRFGLSPNLISRLRQQPEHVFFSERSRIARLGVQITCDAPSADQLEGDTLTLTQQASAMIPGYPVIDQLREFFTAGLPVGRLVFCDPESLLTSDEVLSAIERAELKLPASTAISSDGSIVIAPHKVIYELRAGIDRGTFGRILLREDGREILNRYQVLKPVTAVTIPPNEGVITTCSMYLNDHYVVLQSGYALGRNLPATVLDPIKTRGIRIYLEIVNGSTHPIVNPLISAKIYGKPKNAKRERRKSAGTLGQPYSYQALKELGEKLRRDDNASCHYVEKPVAVLTKPGQKMSAARIFSNGPEKACPLSKAECTAARRDFSPKSRCNHIYATSKIDIQPQKRATLVFKYFPNIMEHRDIINRAFEGAVGALYFFEPSSEHGPFLSQQDHHRLQEYHAFGIDVFWVCGLNRRLMVHTIRDGKGYFVTPERLADFHKSMLFAFYGSTSELSREGVRRLGALMDALVAFWGKHIGIVTGGGSGVMGEANAQARKRGILSGANFLEITDQPMTTDVDFCQVFQATCRHSRQKWFEVASFPIFNIGGLGSLEELGITLCNMKLSIMERVPIVLFNTHGGDPFWKGVHDQIHTMVKAQRAPAWILNNLIITDDPGEVIDAYRERLQLF
ncbi:MAG: LOG family protein [Thermodesulfobacteriota bacterium]